MKTILVDPSLCIQCCDCQIACKDEHCDNDWSPLAAPQEEGQFWIQVRERQVASGSRMRQERVPVMCQQCKDAPCIAAAQAAGHPEAVYRRDDGIVIFDTEKARGCHEVMDACPYGVVYWNDVLDLPQKCTMCAHLLDAGWERPRCVAACPRDALRFVDTSELEPQNMYAPLEHLHSEYGTNPTVAYVNIPKPFVAGEVYSPVKNRCLDDVTVMLTNEATLQRWETKTDYFGEFKVEGISDGYYTLELEKEGYGRKRVERLDVRGALNTGSIALYETPC